MRHLLVGVVLLALVGAPAGADDVDVRPEESGFLASGQTEFESSVRGGGSSQAENVSSILMSDAVCLLGGQQTCSEQATCDDGTPMSINWLAYSDGVSSGPWSSCTQDSSTVAAPPTITPGLVLQAFRRIPLPAADLVIQPPNGRTLVNFKTNFYTEQGELSRTVTLLGRQVELRIWPASFQWRFGDGESAQTTEPGAAYPDLQVTHEYTQKGRVAPSVDTTYAAQFRVGAGPWRDVAGTVTIPGTPQALRVVEARPVLVGG